MENTCSIIISLLLIDFWKETDKPNKTSSVRVSLIRMWTIKTSFVQNANFELVPCRAKNSDGFD